MKVATETVTETEVVTTVTESVTKTILVALTEEEAQHVEWALFNTYVRERDHGGVWLPFAHALTKAGIKTLDKVVTQ